MNSFIKKILIIYLILFSTILLYSQKDVRIVNAWTNQHTDNDSIGIDLIIQIEVERGNSNIYAIEFSDIIYGINRKESTKLNIIFPKKIESNQIFQENVGQRTSFIILFKRKYNYKYQTQLIIPITTKYFNSIPVEIENNRTKGSLIINEIYRNWEF